MTDRVIRIIVDASGVKKGTTAAKKELKGLGAQAKRARQGFGLLKGGIIGVVAALGVREIIDAGDAWANLNGQLKLVTDSQGNLLQTQNDLFDIAQRNRQSLESTADLYTRLARSTDFTQDRIKALTETIGQAITLSQASPESAKAALFQLGQGFAAGALRGEELNSVMEQTPELAKAIADGLGIPIGKLRELGAAGELTAEKVAEGLEAAAATVASEFEKVPLTVGQAVTQVGNSTLQFIGRMDEALGATSALAKGLSSLSRGITGLSIAFSSGTFGFGGDADKIEKQILDLQDRARELQQIANGGTVSTGPGQFSFRFIDPDEAADAKAQIEGINGAIEEFKRIQLDVLNNGGIFPDPEADAKRAALLLAEQERLAAEARAKLQDEADKLVGSFDTTQEKAIATLQKINDFIAADLIKPEDAARVKARLDDIINPLEEIEVTATRRELDAVSQAFLDTIDNADNLREQLEALARGGDDEFKAILALQQAQEILDAYNGTTTVTVEQLAKVIAEEQALAEAVSEATGEIIEQSTEFEDFKRRARENSQDILAGFLENGLQDLDTFAAEFAKMLLALASQALAAGIFEKILGSADGGGGGFDLGGFLGSIFGGGGARQFGGGVQAGQAVSTGEGGRFNAEAFVPNQGGTVVPLGMDRGGGVAPAPNVNITSVNALDQSEIIGSFNDGAGDTVLLNRISVRRTAFKRALGL